MLKKKISKKVQLQIKKIAKDRISGSSLIVEKCARLLLEWAINFEEKDSTFFTKDLYEIGRCLVAAHPDMASIFTLVDEAIYVSKEGPKALRKFLRFFLKTRKEIYQQIADHGFSLIKKGDTIFTYSFSGLVYEVFKNAHKQGKKFQVIVSEARPRQEGTILAQKLARLGIETTLIVDAAAFSYLPFCQKVFVGADRVAKKFFVNKIGTYALLLGAHQMKRKTYVFSESSKFLAEQVFPFRSRLEPEDEILRKKVKNLEVENSYFEKIPISYITKLVSERGIIFPKKVVVYNPKAVQFSKFLKGQRK